MRKDDFFILIRGKIEIYVWIWNWWKVGGNKSIYQENKEKGFQMLEYGFKMIHLKSMMYLNLCVCFRLNKQKNWTIHSKIYLVSRIYQYNKCILNFVLTYLNFKESWYSVIYIKREIHISFSSENLAWRCGVDSKKELFWHGKRKH